MIRQRNAPTCGYCDRLVKLRYSRTGRFKGYYKNWEHFRGYDKIEIERPPPEVLEQKIASARNQIAHATWNLARYEQQMTEGLRNG